MDRTDWFFNYLPVTDEAIKQGLYVTSVGCQRTRPGEHFPPRQHPLAYHFHWEAGRTLPEFAIVLFTEGQGQFESAIAGEQTIYLDNIVIITPGQWHRYRPDPATGYVERWICFIGETPHDLLDCGLLDPVDTVMRVSQPEALVAQFDRMLDNVHNQPGINSIALTHHALALLGMTLTITDRQQDRVHTPSVRARTAASDPLVSQALDIIWTYCHGTLTVAKIVDQLATTRRTLERRFRASLGRSILDEINHCHLGRAKRLLSETGLILKRVAYLSGFSCPGRMRLAFLRYMNLTPTQCRHKTR